MSSIGQPVLTNSHSFDTNVESNQMNSQMN
jgi:hypothetical protein